MTADVWILGIHMTKFGKHPQLDTVDLAAEAALGALSDGGVTMQDMGVLAAGNLLGSAGAHIGQQLQKQIGQTGIPVYNVANACATGATALRTAIMAVKAGEADMGMAVGVEKLAGAGLLAGGSRRDDDTWTPRGRYGAVAPVDGRIGTETMPGVFAQVGMEYGHRYGGTSFELFARISEKNHAHSTLNPLAAYTKRMTLEQIMGDVMIAYPNTRPMCSANCDGAAAAVVVSDAKLKTLALEQRRRAVKVSASVLTSDPWQEACQVLPDVNTLTRRAAEQAYEQAGVGPDDLDLVELHDCFATAELVHYDNLGLCEQGGAVDFFESGAPWRDGRKPVNVSGGLQSKGHPIAATGIANIWEVVHHLRGEAGDRQIQGATVGLAHVIGLASACGVHILERSAA
jgi:acetyl-CoA acyltransferase